MLKKLLEQRAAKTGELKTLHTKAFGDDGTADDLTQIKTLADEIEALDEKIALAERSENLAKAAARDDTADPASSRADPVAKSPTDAAGKLGVLLQGMLKAHWEHGKATASHVQRALEDMGYGGVPQLIGAKALTTLTGPSGGFAVPEDFSEQLIPLLYVESSFMQGNPVRIPMPRGNWRQAGGQSGSVASYRGEGDDISVTAPTFRDVDMSAHLLSAIVPATNQFLDYSVAGTAEFVRSDLAQAMSLKVDEVAYFGTGTGDVPLGILRKTGVPTVSAAATGTTPTVQQIEGVMSIAMAVLDRYPALRSRLEWRFSPRTMRYLSMLRAAGGDNARLYPELQGDAPRWMGLPIRIAGTFPENGGTGTNETSIALISFGHTLYGESKGLVIDVSDTASYKDAGGQMQSAFSTDSTLFRARMEHDFESRYVQSAVLISGVKWGAPA